MYEHSQKCIPPIKQILIITIGDMKEFFLPPNVLK